MSVRAAENAERLRKYFASMESALVAFSGGVDSSVLAKAAYDALGKKALAVTIDSPAIEREEISSAKRTARQIGIKHAVLRLDILKNRGFRSNEPDRCYRCKRVILSALKEHGKEHCYASVIEGTNAEEVSGHRPGFRAVKEAGALSPLADLGLKKGDIRELAAYLGLPNADKPSNPCLATRIPHGTQITRELLEKVELAENAVRSAGVEQLRVRCLGETAVIEVLPEDFGKVLAGREKACKDLRKLGFRRVALDLEGYSTGSMDR